MTVLKNWKESLRRQKKNSDDLATLPPSDLAQATMKGQTVVRQFDIIDGFATTIKRNIEDPKAVDIHVLTNYYYILFYYHLTIYSTDEDVGT